MVAGDDRTFLGYKSRLLPCWPEMRDPDEKALISALARRQHMSEPLPPILSAIAHVMGDVEDPFIWPESLWDLTPTA